VDKRVTLFDIGAYDFIQSARDAPQYEQRRDLMQKGLGTITALETKCESDLMEAHTHLLASAEAMFDVALKSYQEVWVRTCERYKELMRSLRESRNRLERLITEKDFQAYSEDLELCESVPSGSLFRLVTGDCRLATVEVLMRHLVLLPTDGKAQLEVARRKTEGARLKELAIKQAEKGSADMAETVVSFAKEFGVEASELNFTSAAAQFKAAVLKQLAVLLPSTVKQSPTQVVAECSALAQEANKRGEFEKAVEALQRGKTVLQQQAMGNSVLFLQLNNSLAETYHQSARWQDMMSLSEHTLGVWDASMPATEGIRALYFLITAHYWLQHTKLWVILADWPDKLVVSTNLDRCLMYFIQATLLMSVEKLEEATDKVALGLTLCQQFNPNSYLAACSRITLARIYQDMCMREKTGEQLVQAQKVLSVHFPCCFFAGICLSFLGEYYKSIGKLELAVQKFLAARQLYSQYFPLSNQLVSCLHNLAIFQLTQNRLTESESLFVETLRILNEAFPDSMELGNCYASLGDLYNKMRHTKKAEAHYQKACQHFSAHYPESQEYAESLMELAMLLEAKGKNKKAATKAEAARQIYTNAGCHALAGTCEFVLMRLHR
jgi:tetratricopeptide (TPR) repeat protein